MAICGLFIYLMAIKIFIYKAEIKKSIIVLINIYLQLIFRLSSNFYHDIEFLLHVIIKLALKWRRFVLWIYCFIFYLIIPPFLNLKKENRCRRRLIISLLISWWVRKYYGEITTIKNEYVYLHITNTFLHFSVQFNKREKFIFYARRCYAFFVLTLLSQILVFSIFREGISWYIYRGMWQQTVTDLAFNTYLLCVLNLGNLNITYRINQLTLRESDLSSSKCFIYRNK